MREILKENAISHRCCAEIHMFYSKCCGRSSGLLSMDTRVHPRRQVQVHSPVTPHTHKYSSTERTAVAVWQPTPFALRALARRPAGGCAVLTRVELALGGAGFRLQRRRRRREVIAIAIGALDRKSNARALPPSTHSHWVRAAAAVKEGCSRTSSHPLRARWHPAHCHHHSRRDCRRPAARTASRYAPRSARSPRPRQAQALSAEGCLTPRGPRRRLAA